MTNKLTPQELTEILHANIGSSDCAVIALQAVTKLSYDDAEALARKHGYDPELGAQRHVLPAALHELGYTLVPVAVDRTDTAATFSLMHEYGTYLVYVNVEYGRTGGHVCALVDGDLYNGKAFWSAPIDQVWRIEQ